MGHGLHGLPVFLICFEVGPQGLFIGILWGGAQGRRLRVPEAPAQEIQLGLGSEKIRVQHMAQLMGEQAADSLIAVLPACLLGHHGMARVDVDDLVVGIGRVGRPRFPKKL